MKPPTKKKSPVIQAVSANVFAMSGSAIPLGTSSSHAKTKKAGKATNWPKTSTLKASPILRIQESAGATSLLRA